MALELRTRQEEMGMADPRAFYTLNSLTSQATRMLVWEETPKHLGEPVSLRKMSCKEHLEAGEGGSDKICFQGEFSVTLLDPRGMGRLADGVYTSERKRRGVGRGW